MPKATRPKTSVALVTGASRRIGRSIALGLAADGWTVAIHYRSSRDHAEQLVAEIERAGGTAAALGADLAQADEVTSLVPRCAALVGPPTCLVNNASEFRLDTLDTMTPETWDLHMAVNLRAPVFLSRAMAAGLPAGVEGNVINIVDQRVLKPSPEFYSYTVSKSALWTATRTLAQALAPRVRVNAIGPGPVLQSIHQHPDEFAAECRATLLGRGVDSREIADAVRFILGATAMTGQMIALDGGQHLA
jgi:NAD(P)-dependent dehydrogenase (short-subunit alcohol dehydrogenase family)